MKKGTIISKRNFTTFSGKPYIQVEMSEPWSMGQYRINGKFVIHPDLINYLSERQAKRLQEIWDDCILKEHVDVEGREPCSRADGQSKKEVKPNEVQSKLFEIRMKRKDFSFQAYICPECEKIHIGRNPYVPKDRLEHEPPLTGKEIFWTTGTGEMINVDELDHQHMSNIIWFSNIFWDLGNYPLFMFLTPITFNNVEEVKKDEYHIKAIEVIKERIKNEFDNVVLPWKPLPIKKEIQKIKATAGITISKEGDILIPVDYSLLSPLKVIGSLAHIPDWEKY